MRKIISSYKSNKYVPTKNKRLGIFGALKKTTRVSNHERDYAWNSPRENPYHLPTKKAKTKAFGIIIGGTLGTVATLWLLLFHPFFEITKIVVSGLERIPEDKIKFSITEEIEKKILFIPKKNYTIVSVRKIKNKILNEFPVAKVVVKKKFPNTLSVEIQEKISTLVYTNGEAYAFLDLQGNILEIVSESTTTDIEKPIKDLDLDVLVATSTITEAFSAPNDSIATKYSKYPIIYDKRNKELKGNVLGAKTVSGAVAWYEKISGEKIATIKYFEIQNELGDASIITGDGWTLRVKLTDAIDTQLTSLKTVLQKQKKLLTNISYIDVRYSQRVYWK